MTYGFRPENWPAFQSEAMEPATVMLPDRRRALLTAALGFLQLRGQPPEVAPLPRWLDTWTGVGHIVTGMTR